MHGRLLRRCTEETYEKEERLGDTTEVVGLTSKVKVDVLFDQSPLLGVVQDERCTVASERMLPLRDVLWRRRGGCCHGAC